MGYTPPGGPNRRCDCDGIAQLHYWRELTKGQRIFIQVTSHARAKALTVVRFYLNDVFISVLLRMVSWEKFSGSSGKQKLSFVSIGDASEVKLYPPLPLFKTSRALR